MQGLILHQPVKITRFTIIKFLESSSIMKTRQEVYYTAVLNQKNASRSSKWKTLLAELFNDCLSLSVPTWDPHDWLHSWRNFWDLKLENEGGNLFCFSAAIDGRVEPQLLRCRKLPIFAFSQHWGFNNCVWARLDIAGESRNRSFSSASS